MSSDTIQPAQSDLPEYTTDMFRSYVSIMRETLAVLEPDHQGMYGLDLPSKTLSDLQWHDLLERLRGHCLSEQARTIAEQLPLLQHRASTERRLVETEEAQRLIATDSAPPIRGLSPIGAFIEHATRGGILDGEYLLEVATCARVAGEVKSYFRKRAHLAPLLGQIADDLIGLPQVVATISKAFDPAGELADHASPDLGALRRRVANYHERLRRQIDGYVKNPDLQNALQDSYYTLREDRYVLPIRSGAKNDVPGIVHGTSGTGLTIFIEPTALVDLNNDLRLAQLEVAEEERRILSRLSRIVANEGATLSANLEILTYLDVTCAMGHMALELNANRPVLSHEGILDLRQAQHPMLVYKSQDAETPFKVVANDFTLGQRSDDGERKHVLIISGPNTGGKTVSLKTLGLFSLMVRAGLMIPAQCGSTIPLFRGIFTDIGDEQSIERDLSTFSGHVVNITRFLDRVDDSSLVLLDELFAGTDPVQGASLATALLEHLGNRGALVAVTTHLEGVKTLAIRESFFVNAAVGFDVESLSPTYRLTTGLPGSSYAIRIARRLGLQESILGRARSLSDGLGQAEIEQILQQLEQAQIQVEREHELARSAKRDAQKVQQRLKRELETLKKQQRRWVDDEIKSTMEELNAAKASLRAQVKALQNASSLKTVSHDSIAEARGALDKVEATVSKHKDKRARQHASNDRRQAKANELSEGDSVWVLSFKRMGTVRELLNNNKATVQIGSIRTAIPLSDLYVSHDGPQRPAALKKGRNNAYSSNTGEAATVIPPQHDGNTVDLRGLRADDAIERLEMFLDASYHADEPGIYIIHGHGTGALKRAVRVFLPSSRYINNYRPGGQGEGGDGVTVAYFN